MFNSLRFTSLALFAVNSLEAFLTQSTQRCRDATRAISWPLREGLNHYTFGVKTLLKKQEVVVCFAESRKVRNETRQLGHPRRARAMATCLAFWYIFDN